MMDQDDFEEINRLLERCCDNCLLTRFHCATCRIEKLRGIIGKISQSGAFELVGIEELKVLLKLAGNSGEADSSEREIVEKWQRTVRENC